MKVQHHGKASLRGRTPAAGSRCCRTTTTSRVGVETKAGHFGGRSSRQVRANATAQAPPPVQEDREQDKKGILEAFTGGGIEGAKGVEAWQASGHASTIDYFYSSVSDILSFVDKGWIARLD